MNIKALEGDPVSITRGGSTSGAQRRGSEAERSASEPRHPSKKARPPSKKPQCPSKKPRRSRKKLGTPSKKAQRSSKKLGRSSKKPRPSGKKPQRSSKKAQLSASEAQRRGSRLVFTLREGGSGNRRTAKASSLQGKTPNPRRGWKIYVNYDISSVRASDLAPRERTGVLSAASQGRVRV